MKIADVVQRFNAVEHLNPDLHRSLHRKLLVGHLNANVVQVGTEPLENDIVFFIAY